MIQVTVCEAPPLFSLIIQSSPLLPFSKPLHSIMEVSVFKDTPLPFLSKSFNHPCCHRSQYPCIRLWKWVFTKIPHCFSFPPHMITFSAPLLLFFLSFFCLSILMYPPLSVYLSSHNHHLCILFFFSLFSMHIFLSHAYFSLLYVYISLLAIHLDSIMLGSVLFWKFRCSS